MRKLPHGIQGAGLGQRRDTGFRASSQVVRPPDNARDMGSTLGREESLEKETDNTPVFLPKNSIDEPGGLWFLGSQRMTILNDWEAHHPYQI